MTLVKRMLSQCEVQVLRIGSFAFPLAYVCVAVGAAVPPFMDLLLAKLQQVGVSGGVMYCAAQSVGRVAWCWLVLLGVVCCLMYTPWGCRRASPAKARLAAGMFVLSGNDAVAGQPFEPALMCRCCMSCSGSCTASCCSSHCLSLFNLLPTPQACPLLVPRHNRRAPGASDADFFKGLGYRMVDDTKHEGLKRLETADEYVSRMTAMVLLFASIVQTESAANPLPLSHGWAWLARCLNTMPPNRCACVVCFGGGAAINIAHTSSEWHNSSCCSSESAVLFKPSARTAAAAASWSWDGLWA
jgi:hypothetical protein